MPKLYRGKCDLSIICIMGEGGLKQELVWHNGMIWLVYLIHECVVWMWIILTRIVALSSIRVCIE